MNSQETDKKIQQLFSEQRAADTQRVPSFAGVWQTAVARREEPVSKPWGFSLAIAASASVMLVAGVMLWNYDTKPTPAMPATAVASISNWTSPTDCLLDPLTWSASSGSKPSN